jgi:hypothetical protein
MRKYPIVILFSILIVAISGAVAASAYAEGAEWLINGAKVTSLLPVQATVETLYVNPNNNRHVVCTSYFLDGSIDPGGAVTWLEYLTLAGALISLINTLKCSNGTGSTCETSETDIEFSPENLPWTGTIELVGGVFDELLSKESYFISCLVLGIKVTEECTSENTLIEAKNVASGVEFVGVELPLGTCAGTKETGEVEEIKDLLTSTEGTLSVSE